MTLISKDSVIGIVQKHGDEIDDELYHAMMGEIRELPVHKKIMKQVWSYGIGDPEIARCPFCGLEVDTTMIENFDEYYHFCPSCGTELGRG